MVASGVKRPIDDADAMIAEALRYADDPNAPRVEGDRRPTAGDGGGRRRRVVGRRIRRVLMTGVSYMIPFVAAGGLLIALASCSAATRSSVPTATSPSNNTLFNLPDRRARSGSSTPCSTARFFAYLGALLLHASAARRSASSCPRWPATSPTPSPTAPASRPAS